MAAKNKDTRRPYEAILILQNLDADTLRQFADFADTPTFESLQGFCRRYIETKRNQILDLPTEDERKLANEMSMRKGNIMAIGVLTEVIKGAKTELSTRKED